MSDKKTRRSTKSLDRRARADRGRRIVARRSSRKARPSAASAVEASAGRGMSSPGRHRLAGECPAATARVIPAVAASGPIRPGGVIMLPPGGYGPGPGGPGTVVVVDDDDDRAAAPPQDQAASTKKQEQKQQKTQKQIAQRAGFNPPPPGEQRFVPNEVLLNIRRQHVGAGAQRAGAASSPDAARIARLHAAAAPARTPAHQ